MSVDLRAAAAMSGGTLRRAEVALLQTLVLAGLYPNVAVADPGNARRRESDQRFITRKRTDGVLHPTCGLTGDAAPADSEALVYGSMVETSRLFISNVTRVPALALLLVAGSVETTRSCGKMLIDGWVLLRMSADVQEGQSALREAAALRRLLSALLKKQLSRTTTGRAWALAGADVVASDPPPACGWGGGEGGGAELPPFAAAIAAASAGLVSEEEATATSEQLADRLARRVPLCSWLDAHHLPIGPPHTIRFQSHDASLAVSPTGF